MSRPIWFVNIIKHFFPNRFQIAGLSKKSGIAKRIIDYLLFENDELYYLPVDQAVKQTVSKVGREGRSKIKEILPVNEEVIMEDDILLPSQIVEHFINQAESIWINYKCICRDAAHCKEYPVEMGCIFMGEAVKNINPKLGHLVSREEAHKHLKRARELGLLHLIGRNKIDTWWMGIGPGHKLLTICHCCPCCCLYKVLPDLDGTIRSKVSKMPGVSIKVNPEKCKGCGSCTRGVCIVDAILLKDSRAMISDTCVGCGKCVNVCPNHAIEISIEDATYIDTVMHRISEKVDVR